MQHISGSRMLELMKSLDFPRVAGTDGEKKAAEMLLREARALGIDAVLDAYELKAAVPEAHSLRILSPEDEVIECTPLSLSGSTPESGVEAPVVFVDAGAPKDVQHAKDCIALLYGTPKTRVWEELNRAGAKAVVCIAEPEKGLPHDSIDVRWIEQYGSIPGVMVSFKDGLRLVRQNGLTARLVHVERQHTAQSHNVICTVQGTSRPEEVIVVGAHYDSVRVSCGMHDDLAGTAVAWELMRHFADHPASRTIKFIAFGGEEEGLLGSIHFVENNPDLLKRVKMLVNLDVGGGIIGRDTVSVNATDEVLTYIEQYDKEQGTGWDIGQRPYGGDNIPFVLAGIPAITFFRSSGTAFYIHTKHDSIKWIDENRLARWAHMVLPLLARWANAYEFPFKLEVSDTTQKQAAKLLKDFSGAKDEHLERLKPKKKAD